MRAEGGKGPPETETPALQPESQLVGKLLLLADVHDAQAGEVAVLGAERSIQNIDILDQLRRQALQLSQVALSVRLAVLVLLDIVDQDLQAHRCSLTDWRKSCYTIALDAYGGIARGALAGVANSVTSVPSFEPASFTPAGRDAKAKLQANFRAAGIHGLAFLASLLLVAYALYHERLDSAGWVLSLIVLLNAYPVVLQH